MKRNLLATMLTGALVLLSAGPARGDDYDINQLPPIDANTLSKGITIWSVDADALRKSITSWSPDGSIADLAKTKQESGETVVTLDADILFEFAKSALSATSKARIATAVAKAPKGAAVAIGGHTDDVGSNADNLKLSQARAQAVAAALKAARPDLVLTLKGFGETRPVASNSDSPGRSENRRVEIRFAG